MLSGKTALVSGPAGFLGAHVTRALLNAGARVIGLVRDTTDCWRIDGLLDEPDFVLRPVPADFVFHLAASGVQPVTHESELLENIELTHALLESAAPGTRFIYAGSCFEYPAGLHLAESVPLQPRTLYGVTKAASTMLVNSYAQRLHVTTLRLFTIYGPKETPPRLIPSAIRAALNNQSLATTQGEQLRDFVYVEDAARAFLSAATAPIASGEVINIASGRPTRIRDVVEQIYRLAVSHATPDFGALSDRKDEYMQLTGNPAKAESLLGWRATTTLEAGIARTIESLTAQTVSAESK